MDIFYTKGWRVFAAHLSDWGFFSYICGGILAIFTPPTSVVIIFTFLLGLIVSIITSSLLVAIWGITPSEWLWGCKIEDNTGENKFFSYVKCRLRLNDLEFVDYKSSFAKTLCGVLVLSLIIGFWCL